MMWRNYFLALALAVILSWLVIMISFVHRGHSKEVSAVRQNILAFLHRLGLVEGGVADIGGTRYRVESISVLTSGPVVITTVRSRQVEVNEGYGEPR